MIWLQGKPPRASAAVIASFNPGIQQMLQIRPHMPSVAQPPSKWPFNFNCSPQRGPIKAEASRARITGKSFEGRRPQGRLANGFPPPLAHCARLRVGWRAALEMGGEMQYRWQRAWQPLSIPRAQNFQNEIYGAGPPSLRRKHLLQQLWERPLTIGLLCREQAFAANWRLV